MIGGATRLLTGIALCGLCGATLHAGITRTGAPTYRCSTVAHLDRAAGPVDDYVAGVLLEYLARERLTRAPAGEDVAGLARDVAALRARFDEAADLYANGAVTGTQLARMTASLKGQLEAAEGRMAAAVNGSVLRSLPLDIEALVEMWDGIANDVERRRAIIRATPLAGVRVFPPGRGVHRFDPATVKFPWERV